MEGLEELLRGHPFLRDLSEAQRRFLLGCASAVAVQAGALMLREGEEAKALYLLREGQVRLELHLPGRGAVQMESLGAGDILGLSWLFAPYRWQLDARAITPVRALAFDGPCLRARMEEDHDLGYALSRPLLGQLYERLKRVRLQRADLYREGR